MAFEYWQTQEPGSVGDSAAYLREQEQLAAGLKARSTSAWDGLYRDYYVRVRKFAFASLRSESEAEDTAAMTFQRALSAIDTFNYRGVPVAAWLFRIARNVINERRRFISREASRTVQNSEDSTGFSALDVAAPGSQSLSLRLELLEALDELTSEQRDVFLLINVVGFSTKEVADLLGKTERAIYYVRARALIRLREAMS